MDFVQWFSKQSINDQSVMLSNMMEVLMDNMKGAVMNSSGFTREQARDIGVTQAYKAGEGFTDLRWRWDRWRDIMATMDVLIVELEERAKL